MYKYIGVDEKTSVQARILNNDLSLREFPRNLKSDAKTKKIFRFCNLPHEIAADTEGTYLPSFFYLLLIFLLIILKSTTKRHVLFYRNISKLTQISKER